jgi:RNA polymerase sigma-70 factor (ECF subfamily)
MQATLPNMTAEPFPKEFDALFQEHYRLVYCTAYGILGRVEDAEDVVQTIFLRLLRREPPWNFSSQNPQGYLYRAAVNESLTLVQKRQRRERSEVGEEVADAVPARASSQTEQQHARLYDAIAKLNRKAASILILRYLHDYSDKDIAKLLGTSRGVIAVSLYRSRRRLKTLLGGSPGEGS